MANHLNKIPAVRARVEAGQMFNAYESSSGGFLVGVGPVTDFLMFARTFTAEMADMIVDALRDARGQPRLITSLSAEERP